MQRQYRHQDDMIDSNSDCNSVDLSPPANSPIAVLNGRDPRPRWQQLDDEEDWVLLKRRKLIGRLQQAAFVTAISILLFWVISH